VPDRPVIPGISRSSADSPAPTLTCDYPARRPRAYVLLSNGSPVPNSVNDLATGPLTVRFYQAAFDATYNEDISSFQFGTWPADDFFLLTIADQDGQHRGPTGASRFGLLVSNVDDAHRRARRGRNRVLPRPSTNPGNPGRRASSIPAGT
jgi:hypothetical protein